MGRPAKFSADSILDATADVIARDGPGRATVSSIAQELGAPSGSIYHRFESRDLILARLWVRTVRRHQAGFIAALAQLDLDDAARDAVLHIPRWSRDHFNEAVVLVLYRREDLAERWPDELGPELHGLNDGLLDAARDYARRRYGTAARATMEAVGFALFDVPYAAVRRHLAAGHAPPDHLDALILTAASAVLDDHHPAAPRRR